MKTLGNLTDQRELLDRLAQFTEADKALWGSMSVQQAICHLNDAYQVALGRKSTGPGRSVPLPKVMKWFALQTPMKWPKGVPTLPEVEQGKGGTPPGDFGLDHAALLLTVERFKRDLPFPCLPHGIFGKMSAADWLRWGYLHADHHLRQFGH